MQLLVEFNGPSEEQNEHITKFFGFVCQKLGILDHPVITFSPDLGTTSFGLYHPASASVSVAIEGRHISDILRTFAHELVHHKQLTSGSQLDLEGLEYEANAVAGMLMRDYNKLHPELFGLDKQAPTPEGIPGESQGPVADDTTRPSQPIELAELSNKTLASYKRKAKASDRWRDRSQQIYQVKWKNATQGNPKTMGRSLEPISQSDIDKRKHGIETAENTLRKRYAVQEEAPVNAAGSGDIAGLGVGPQGEPGIKKSKMIRRKPKNDLAKIFSGLPKKTFKDFMKEK